MQQKTNRLATETSRYLNQHANNPVDWFPWGTEALEIARRENKPIILSIGYSACHWCHVMADESFADLDTAKIMNELFVNIKVDREERPDLDKVYQTAHQILTGRGGGWPLTVFLNPHNLTPFFAGTYFSSRASSGIPSFKDVLRKIAQYYKEHPTEIAEQNNRIDEALKQLIEAKKPSEEALTHQPLLQARRQLAAEFDPLHGGFGTQPKFPQATNLHYLLDWWIYSQSSNHEDKSAFAMIQATLEQMAKGGIYDQLGGGFFRYTVDASWQIPHFEKMLYDNGQLLGLYSKVSSLHKSNLFKRVVNKTADWLLSKMLSPEGAFYATLDADSEHHEGKYYYWNREQFHTLLTEDELEVAVVYFGLDRNANFEGHWHLHIVLTAKQLAKKLHMDLATVKKLLSSAKRKLFAAREQRISPGRDEKIITSWNALVIKGLVQAGFFFQRQDLISAAHRAMDFMMEKMWVGDELMSTYQNGQTKSNAFLDDYAFLLDAILALLEVEWRTSYLNFAIRLADNLINYFEDSKHGGFFFTAGEQETLIQRPKPLMDEAIPAGNGLAALSFLRLGYLLGESRYLLAAENTLKMAWDSIQDYPAAHCSLLMALQEFSNPPQIIILRGVKKELSKWLELSKARYNPQRLVFAIPSTETPLPESLTEYRAIKGKVLAYVCQGKECKPPIDNFEEFEELLR